MASRTSWMKIINRHPVDADATQRRVLRALLQQGADTEWGRRYRFSEIARDADPVRMYRKTVPIHTYDAYRDDVRRVRAGARDVFWPGLISHFAVSSGTVSDGRIIPVSHETLQCNRRFSLAVGSAYLKAGGKKDVAFGRVLSVPGRVEEDPERPGVWLGEISGLLALYTPSFIRTCHEAVSRDIQFQSNWDRKLDRIVDVTLVEDICSVVMVPSWAVVLFRKLIDRFNNRFGRAVTTVREIWPNFTAFFSGGVALSSYRTLLQRQIGADDIHFIESYGASEGFISYQDRIAATDMLVQLENGIFLEFVRHDDTSDTPRRYAIGEVETEVRYSLHVTTCSGLWCYPIGDIVAFTSTDPHRIVVVGRTNEMMDTYGEAVYGDEARAALEAACRSSGSSFRDYHVAPIPLSDTRMPGHQWLLEFEEAPEDLKSFAGAIDAYLISVNRHYATRREANAFSAPQVVSLSPGTFYRWFIQDEKSVGAQSKIPRMADDRRIADEVLSISGNIT